MILCMCVYIYIYIYIYICIHVYYESRFSEGFAPPAPSRGRGRRRATLNNIVTVLARYHMLHAALKLCLPQMPKSSMNYSKKVCEEKKYSGQLGQRSPLCLPEEWRGVGIEQKGGTQFHSSSVQHECPFYPPLFVGEISKVEVYVEKPLCGSEQACLASWR